jgi:hypothetical protein
MKKIFLILLIYLATVNCKSNSNLKGNYQTVSIDKTVYNFNMNNKKFNFEYIDGSKRNGKFKSIILSPTKTLIICNDMILKRGGGFIKELTKNNDSTVVGVYDGYKNLGSTIFEITLKEDERLIFRKTYSTDLKITESEGEFIPKN